MTQPRTDQNLNERKQPSVNGDGTRHEKKEAEQNDAQRNAAERVADGTDKSVLPIAERHAGEDCDSSVEDQ